MNQIKNNNKKFFKKSNNKGITLMELIIALAIIAIIAGIVALNLFGTTDRARIRSDIQSTLVLRSALDIYKLRPNHNIGDISTVLDTLYDLGYINSPTKEDSTQTAGAYWVIHNNNIYLDLTNVNINTNFLNNNEGSIIKGWN